MAKRKIPKRQKVQPKLYTQKDLDAAARRGVESSAKFNIYLTMGSTLMALHQLYGFGNKRLNDVIDRALDIELKALNYTELLDALQTETGIDLRELEAHRNDL